MEIKSESVGGRAIDPSVTEVGGAVAADAAAEVAVPSAKPSEGPVLKGDGIENVVLAPKGLPGEAPTKEEALLSISQQMYESLKNIVNNLKPSKKEMENLRRRQEEIKKLQQEIQDRKIDFEEARVRFINLLDHEDVAEFAKQAEREAGWLKG